jgi:uncharacterized protein YndB with AHSA1/START domain
MTRLLWVVGTVIAVIGLVAGIGWLLPVAHTASRQAALPVLPSDVYATVTDVARYPTWWPEVSQVDMLPTDSGRIRFRQHTSSGPVVMEIEDAVFPSRLVTAIADPDQPFAGTWTFEIVPDGSGSRVTITERGEINNPMFRFMARFVFGYTGTMESCLRALERKFS